MEGKGTGNIGLSLNEKFSKNMKICVVVLNPPTTHAIPTVLSLFSTFRTSRNPYHTYISALPLHTILSETLTTQASPEHTSQKLPSYLHHTQHQPPKSLPLLHTPETLTTSTPSTPHPPETLTTSTPHATLTAETPMIIEFKSNLLQFLIKP